MSDNIRIDKDRYTLKEAAKELGCSRSDINQYLYNGLIRYGIDTMQIQCDAVISMFDIIQLKEIKTFRAKTQKTPEDCKSVFIKINDIDISKLSQPPDYLYSPITDIRKLPKSSRGELWSCFFYTFEGEPVYPLTFYKHGSDAVYNIGGGYIGKFKTSKDGYETLKPVVITKEELDRFKSTNNKNKPSENKEHSSTETVNKASEVIDEELPFLLPPQRKHPQTEAIVTYGNLYFRKHQEIPKAKQLLSFITEEHPDKYLLEFDEGNNRSPFNLAGKDMNYDSLQDRINEVTKKYRKSNLKP